MRVAATSRASPELASQAENVNKTIGASDRDGELITIDQIAIAINRESIIPSRQIRADNRWERLKASPVRPRINADVIVK